MSRAEFDDGRSAFDTLISHYAAAHEQSLYAVPDVPIDAVAVVSLRALLREAPPLKDYMLWKLQTATPQERLAIMDFLSNIGEISWPGIVGALSPYLYGRDRLLLKHALYALYKIGTLQLLDQRARRQPRALHPELASLLPRFNELLNDGREDVETLVIPILTAFETPQEVLPKFRAKLDSTPLTQTIKIKSLLTALGDLNDVESIPRFRNVMALDPTGLLTSEIRLILFRLRGGAPPDNLPQVLKNIKAEAAASWDVLRARCSRVMSFRGDRRGP